MVLDVKIMTGFINKQTDWYIKQAVRGRELHFQVNIALKRPNVTFKVIDNLSLALARISESFKKFGAAIANMPTDNIHS